MSKSIAKIVLLFAVSFVFLVHPTLAEEQKILTYENTAMGIKFSGPLGWYMNSGKEIQERTVKTMSDMTNLEVVKEAIKKVGLLVSFTQYPYGSPREFNPNITLATEPFKPEYKETLKGPLDYANASVVTLKTMLKDFKIIKEPVLKSIGGSECATLTYDGTIVYGYLEIKLRFIAYIFMKDDLIYTLSFTDKADNFNNNVEAFNGSLKTFTLK